MDNIELLMDFVTADQVYGHYVSCSRLNILVRFAEQSGLAMKPLLRRQELSLERIVTPGAQWF